MDNASFAAQLTALRRSGAKNWQGVEEEGLRRLESFSFTEATEVAHALAFGHPECQAGELWKRLVRLLPLQLTAGV